MTNGVNQLIEFLSEDKNKNKIINAIEKTYPPEDWGHEGWRFMGGELYEDMLIKLYPHYDSREGGFGKRQKYGHDLLWKIKGKKPIKVSVKSQKNALEKRKNQTKSFQIKNTMGDNGIEDFDILLIIGRPSNEKDKKDECEICFGAVSKQVYDFFPRNRTDGQINKKIPFYKFGSTLIRKTVNCINDEIDEEITQIWKFYYNAMKEKMGEVRNR